MKGGEVTPFSTNGSKAFCGGFMLGRGYDLGMFEDWEGGGGYFLADDADRDSIFTFY